MELRRLSLYLALFVLAICSQSCSDAHSMHRRDAGDNYEDDLAMGDEASDDEAQNDGNDAEEEIIAEKILTKPTTYNISVGKTLRLECTVTPNHSPVIQWLKNDSPLFMGRSPMTAGTERYVMSKDRTDHDLILQDLEPADSGKYSCKVLQPTGSVMIEHTLNVVDKLRVHSLTATNNGTVMEGDNLLLSCKVAGTPPAKIIWSFTENNGEMNSRLTEADAKFTMDTAYIENIRRNQAGRYICYAWNNDSNAQAEVWVKVLHKPHVHVRKTVVNSALGVEADLQCSAYGEPTADISWYKDGHLITESSRQYQITSDGPNSNLTVTPQEDGDFGTFTCVAQNRHGKHNKSIELVQRPVVEGVNLEGKKLSWTVHSHQPLEQMELHLRDTQGNPKILSVPVPEPNKHIYDVIYVMDGFEPGEYEVVVKARNSKEWSTPSDSEIIKYEEAPQAIQTASVLANSQSHSIRPATNAVVATMFMYLLVRLF